MSLEGKIDEFVGANPNYYRREFRKIQGRKGFTWSWNMAAFCLGPLWGAWRQMWGFFWIFLIGELFSLVQIAKGLWAEPGGELRIRYEQILTNIAKRSEQLKAMQAQGDQEGAQTAAQIMSNLEQVASQLEQQLAQQSLALLLIGGLLLFLLIKIIEGFYANIDYEKRYLRWRMIPHLYPSKTSGKALFFGAILLLLIWPLTIIRFTMTGTEEIKLWGVSLTHFPLERELFSPIAVSIDRAFDWLAIHFGSLFNGITAGISFLINAFEIILIKTPWPVLMIIIVVMALRLVGPKVAIFTAASLAYLALMGLWKASMITVALIATSTLLCLCLGIPLGIWFGRNQKVYDSSRPVLDFMQTMPAFVYLIPIIAFFGTGKPPGVLATVIFAMPPVVRLTALGIRNVSESTKEAAIAFGCSSWQLLRFVEIPLAMPSIMTGINQTIMMGLSMVVVASLIGAEGLGAHILEALQYAAKGQGLLAGLAILFCAMVIDRIIQGSYSKKH